MSIVHTIYFNSSKSIIETVHFLYNKKKKSAVKKSVCGFQDFEQPGVLKNNVLLNFMEAFMQNIDLNHRNVVVNFSL